MSATALPGNVIIRRLSGDDIAVLEKLLPRLSRYHNEVAASFSGIYPIRPYAKELDETRDELAANRALVEVVYREDKPVGFAKGSFQDDAGFIDWLYLDDSLRGLGLGDILLRHLLDFFQANQVRLVDLMVVAGNPAKAFYQKYGFTTRLEMLTLTL